MCDSQWPFIRLLSSESCVSCQASSATFPSCACPRGIRDRVGWRWQQAFFFIGFHHWVKLDRWKNSEQSVSHASTNKKHTIVWGQFSAESTCFLSPSTAPCSGWWFRFLVSFIPIQVVEITTLPSRTQQADKGLQTEQDIAILLASFS